MIFRNAKAFREFMNAYRQVRVVVPLSDWRLYVMARKYHIDYRQNLKSHNRNFLKGKKPGVPERLIKC